MKEQVGDHTLVRLSEVRDFEVASEDENPTGWTVYAGDRPIGRVDDLLVDSAAMKVRYLVVDPDDAAIETAAAGADDAQIHIPVDRVRLTSATRSVELLDIDEAGSFPFREFSGRSQQIGHPGDAASWSRETGDSVAARVTRSEEELRVGKREVQAGEVVVQKSVEAERVREPVTTRAERVNVERRPAGSTTGADPVIEGDEIRVPIMAEEVVVEKRPVVKEEIVITKDVVNEVKDVEAEIRKERVDVDRTGETTTDTRTLSDAETRRDVRRGGGSRG